MVNLTEEDMANLVAFIDATLSPSERARLELRLAREPELARALESLLETDEHMRRSSSLQERAGPRPSVARSRAWWWITSAAAALALALALDRWIAPRSSRSDWVVAIAPSWESPDEYVAHHPELAGLKPPGLGVLRGEDEPANIGAAEFAARARASEDAAPGPIAGVPVSAGYFVIPFTAARPCSVIVVGVPDRGSSLRLYPEPGDARPPAEQARFEAGEHVLPRPRIEVVSSPGAEPSVRYNRGFLVPVGSQEMSVIVAVRTEPLDAGALGQTDDTLARSEDVRSLREILAGRGFELETLHVLEPTD
jgi:hypothetical protein